ncbi:DUF4231 domain-containing protein [Amycolatopsis vancoresmycina]|uniref:SMODS and SLOG-associating 2TM effector domain-containing protein n=1 Tax=Amycolatopsis vancoresmycina DSM 44592 TaxID=1292037 RepID=R1HSF1_9PSEU|nr:DUF4231 domain-containing protein [Amycolatopsis vancoresmycina]EOD66475.1 hypothetical protein H480_21317 [Amycolatopsis vancoresmycina DSM 44592]
MPGSPRRLQWQRLDEALPSLPDPQDEADVVWQHLRAEFAWYHRAATRTRLGYQGLKTVSITVAAAVPVLAAVAAPPAWTASFAAVVVVLEGVQQLFQLHTNYLSYRGSAEAIRQLAYQYAGRVGPYRDAGTRRDALAADLHAVISDEGARWSSTMRKAPGPAPSPGTGG